MDKKEVTLESTQEMDSMLGLDAPEGSEVIEVEDKSQDAPVVEDGKEVEASVKPSEEETVKEASPADTLSVENERLRQELNELARKAGVQPKETPREVLPPKTESTAEVQFLTEEEAEALIDNPKEFNKILNKVYQAGRETTMRDMPALVRQHALMELTIQQKIQGFWSENKDLEKYKDFCSMVASQLEIENPGLAFDEVLSKTADVARQRLNLPEKGKEKGEAPVVEEVPSSSPALPTGTRSARRPAPAPKPSDGQQSEMEALAKAFDL